VNEVVRELKHNFAGSRARVGVDVPSRGTQN
jgi:hypothetical protein